MFKVGGDERGLEAFQQLRSQLHVMFQETHPVIAFTSCDPREGKSSVAAHTAWALATPGQFVVAVDGDLRQPRLHEIFGTELSPGVSDIAVANGPTELMAPTGNRYLELIPAGVPTRHPADIAAADVPRLLRALRRVGSDGRARLPAGDGRGRDDDPGDQGGRGDPRGRRTEVQLREPRARAWRRCGPRERTWWGSC